MKSFAHIFLGKEFEQMAAEIGRVAYKYGNSAESYLNYYLLDFDSSKPSLKQLSLSSTNPSPELGKLDEYIKCEWVDEVIGDSSLVDIYRTNIFSKVLGGSNRGSQNCLYVCVHIPFYKQDVFEKLTLLYQAIMATQTPNKVSFIGYCADLANMIEPGVKVDLKQNKAQLSAFKKFKEKNFLPINCRLTLFQNAFQNGIPLGLDQDSLVNVVAQLILLYVEYYDDIYPDTVAPSDASSFGLASISIDKYRLVEYLLQKSLMSEMERAEVMNSEISINVVFDQLRTLLHNKHKVLSDYLIKTESLNRDDWDIVKAEQFLRDESESIIRNCENIYKTNKSMSMYTALLAAILQTRCDLFKQMVFDPKSPDINDLYVEPIDYFISHDKTNILREDEDTPLENPVTAMKALNLQILNSESEIKDLEQKMQTYEGELSKSKMVDNVIPLSGDGFFHLGEDRRYKLIPRLIEEALQESYEPHEVQATSVDLRSNFAAIKDQGQTGSCLSFAVTSVFEYVMRLINRNKKEFDLSERFLYYNARMLDSEAGDVRGQDGSRFKPTIDSLIQFGIASEEYCAYSPNSIDEKPSAAAYEDAKKRLLKKALNVPRNINAIKSALVDGYPVVASFTLLPSFANIDHGFVPMPSEEEIAQPHEETEHSAHAMTIVGFEDKLQCFLVRNSWGVSWGAKGYCYIPYEYIENEQLFNYACVLTEIDSVSTTELQPKKIAVLKLDDSDINIRYYTALAALRCEQDKVEQTRAKRIEMSQKFEDLKQRLSNHNSCEDYIQLTCQKTKEEQAQLEANVKQEKRAQEQEYEDFVKFRRRLIIRGVIYSVVVWLSAFFYNRLMDDTVAKPQWLQYVADFLKICITWWVNTYNKIFTATYVRDLSVEEMDFGIEWGQYATIAVIIALIFYRGHKHWRLWRNSRDAHDLNINRFKKSIAAKQKEIDEFRFKTQVACKWIGALDKMQTKLQKSYTNIISRMNNLRKWYYDLEDSAQKINFDSQIPNTSVLDKTIVDKAFDTHFKNKEAFAIDFAEGIQEHEISEEYLAAYQKQLRNNVVVKLMSDPLIKEFDMAAHIANDSSAVLAKKVMSSALDDSISVETVKHQSDIFLHLRPINRGVITPSTYLFAPSCHKYEVGLRRKIGSGMEVFLPYSNPDRVTMLQIVSIDFDECVIFQS